MGRSIELDGDDLTFLDTLSDLSGQVSEKRLKTELMECGMSEATYNAVRRRLLFARYIGFVYGNVTLEKSDYEPLEHKSDVEPAEEPSDDV